MSRSPIIAIVGPTASGKTGLAVKLARQFNGEIICADSRTVYRGMDVGTAKPTAEDRRLVPHWGIDIVEPDQEFSVAKFQSYARKKIREIQSRGSVPFIVGGSGLYIDSVLFNFSFGQKADPVLRQHLEMMDIKSLHNYCIKNNIKLPENKLNKRYVIRLIERKNDTGKHNIGHNLDIAVVGITTKKEETRTNIEHRIEHFLTNNVVNEAMILGEKYGWNTESMTGNVYRLSRKYLAGDLDASSFKEQLITHDLRLVKKQMTWFRRNPNILWGDINACENYLANYLSEQNHGTIQGKGLYK